MNKRLIPIIIGVVIIIAAGAFYFISMQDDGEEEILVAVSMEYTPGEYFVTNVKDSNRLLKTALVLILDNDSAELEEMLTNENSLIRDTLIFILRDLTEDDIRSNDTIPALRHQIITELNASLGISNVIEIRFNDFVMQ